MSYIVTKGREVYAALQAGDFTAVRQLLAPQFRAELTAGLPHGMGRTYCGVEAMISGIWEPARLRSDIEPRPDQLYEVGHILIARGFYSGHSARTGRFLHAAFAHFWTFDGNRFTELIQITDTAAWVAALIP